jgi:hypothetical protein
MFVRSTGSLSVRSTNELTFASQTNGDRSKIRNLKSFTQVIFATFHFCPLGIAFWKILSYCTSKVLVEPLCQITSIRLYNLPFLRCSDDQLVVIDLYIYK